MSQLYLYVVEEEIAKQTQNEPVNEHVSEDVFEQAETEFMFTKPQVETFSEDVFEQCETEHYSEPQAEHPIEPLVEP
ncbi:hypothetical protein GQ457_08G016100 [Hibiscus cannabinus]